MVFNLRDLKYHKHHLIYLTFNLFFVKMTQALLLRVIPVHETTNILTICNVSLIKIII